MKHNPVLRYFTDMAESDLTLLYFDLAFQYCEAIGQPLFTTSDTFWKWWLNHWQLIDSELEKTFLQMDGLTPDRCRAIHRSRHRIDPLHRYPNAAIADTIIEEVYEHHITHPVA